MNEEKMKQRINPQTIQHPDKQRIEKLYQSALKYGDLVVEDIDKIQYAKRVPKNKYSLTEEFQDVYEETLRIEKVVQKEKFSHSTFKLLQFMQPQLPTFSLVQNQSLLNLSDKTLLKQYSELNIVEFDRDQINLNNLSEGNESFRSVSDDVETQKVLIQQAKEIADIQQSQEIDNMKDVYKRLQSKNWKSISPLQSKILKRRMLTQKKQ